MFPRRTLLPPAAPPLANRSALPRLAVFGQTENASSEGSLSPPSRARPARSSHAHPTSATWPGGAVDERRLAHLAAPGGGRPGRLRGFCLQCRPVSGRRLEGPTQTPERPLRNRPLGPSPRPPMPSPFSSPRRGCGLLVSPPCASVQTGLRTLEGGSARPWPGDWFSRQRVWPLCPR